MRQECSRGKLSAAFCVVVVTLNQPTDYKNLEYFSTTAVLSLVF